VKLDRKKVAFGHHEFFTLRYSWLTKGYQALGKNENIFAEKKRYQPLGNVNSSLKEWFLTHVQGYLSGKSQVPMNFESDDSRQISEVSS
jgi:hypothetical protein